jgi:uncharacterized protein
MKLKFRCLPGKFGVCYLPADAAIPAWSQIGSLFSITRTDQELSVVCPEESVPPQQACEGGWICLKLEGPFSFSEVGILAAFIDPLRDEGVPIFAISTYNTDYVLIKEEQRRTALDALRKAGHELIAS